ncbi:unnamed protein product [Protopolystoma xenopodis]|uniref:Uncharacterized protein n=1 Tax=Protopolystoma xenopodis TaxID=117903 RepID=A0A448XDZ2_9PLAT|nr:unnamed protein product [Protopolystoma xenopodis]
MAAQLVRPQRLRRTAQSEVRAKRSAGGTNDPGVSSCACVCVVAPSYRTGADQRRPASDWDETSLFTELAREPTSERANQRTSEQASSLGRCALWTGQKEADNHQFKRIGENLRLLARCFASIVFLIFGPRFFRPPPPLLLPPPPQSCPSSLSCCHQPRCRGHRSRGAPRGLIRSSTCPLCILSISGSSCPTEGVEGKRHVIWLICLTSLPEDTWKTKGPARSESLKSAKKVITNRHHGSLGY